MKICSIPRSDLLLSRVLRKVQKDENGCWAWQGARNNCGYGVIGINHRLYLAHRAVWCYTHNTENTPEGFEIDHVCRNRACVCPHHLEAVTRSSNNKRYYSVLGKRGQPTALSA